LIDEQAHPRSGFAAPPQGRNANGPAEPVPWRSLGSYRCMRTADVMTFSPSTIALFDKEVAKYPAEQKASAVMACLAIVQHEQGHVSPEAENAIAAHLGMPPIAVHEVTTFYNMYNQRPVGKYKLNVCTNLPCQLRNGQGALEHVCQRLGVEPYGSTPDGQFTVQPSECLGACADAPVMLLNDRQMLSFMSPERLDELVDLLKAQG
jgi:NADH-quinone oxidoreductase subunit E